MEVMQSLQIKLKKLCKLQEYPAPIVLNLISTPKTFNYLNNTTLLITSLTFPTVLDFPKKCFPLYLTGKIARMNIDPIFVTLWGTVYRLEPRLPLL